MRGTTFYKENRLAVRDMDKSYLAHLTSLNKIKQRNKSSMCKSTTTNRFEIVFINSK